MYVYRRGWRVLLEKKCLRKIDIIIHNNYPVTSCIYAPLNFFYYQNQKMILGVLQICRKQMEKSIYKLFFSS